MSEAEKERYYAAFQMFDKDGVGRVSASNLGSMMKSLGKNPTADELQDMINDADLDGNKMLDFDEFLGMMNKKGDEDDELRHVFAIFDKNGDGYLSHDEVKDAMFKLGEEFTDKEIEDLIIAADLDQDGEVNYREFKRMLSDPKRAKSARR